MARSVGVDRAQVVAVAAMIADEHGLEALTLAQVANQVGVKLPSLYNHVDGLAGLRRELALLACRELASTMSRATIGRAGEDAVVALAQAYRAYVLTYPGRYAATVPAPNPDDYELQAAAREVVEIVVAVVASFGLQGADAIHAVRGLRSLVHGFATLEHAGGFGLPLAAEDSFSYLLHTFVAGLRAALAQA